MSASRLSPLVARLQRRLLEQPGITRLPVCPWCGSEVAPESFGREACKPCEAERSEASAYFEAQLDATLSNAPPAPEHPIFGGDAACLPFLPRDEEG
jgi:hypothetical protein